VTRTSVNRVHHLRVAEIFGPTIQGEGRLVGMPCHFVRFGGCDYRCVWCDTPHAVLPDQVVQLPKMDEWSVITKVLELDQPKNDAFIRWVVLTGGNPALLPLQYLIELLHVRSYKVMLETQGSVYREWFAEVDDLCFSPKPPSSRMDWDFGTFQRILDRLKEDMAIRAINKDLAPQKPPYLKVPVFTDEDLAFADEVHRHWPELEFFVSIGNDDPSLPTVGNPHPDPKAIYPTQAIILDNYKRVTEEILLNWPGLQDARTFPQQHTLLWGNARGH
jgi:7-carboxy-7-deazaguanine synthase